MFVTQSDLEKKRAFHWLSSFSLASIYLTVHQLFALKCTYIISLFVIQWVTLMFFASFFVLLSLNITQAWLSFSLCIYRNFICDLHKLCADFCIWNHIYSQSEDMIFQYRQFYNRENNANIPKSNYIVTNKMYV